MLTPNLITATEARNQFFQLIKTSYLEGKTYVIAKDDIPMVSIAPIYSKQADKKTRDTIQSISSFFQKKYRPKNLSRLVVSDRSRRYKALTKMK